MYRYRLTSTTLTIFVWGIMCIAPPVFAGGKLAIDETKWVSVGAGAKASLTALSERAGDGKQLNGNDFRLENMRLYVNGQIHKYMKIEFNTDCTDCLGGGSGGSMIILDAIGKLEFNQYFNVWAGRLLVPADRAELSGPYFQNTFDFNRTPFYPSDFGNYVAGRFGRDDGVNIWGAFFEDKRLTYVVGIFDGVDSNATRPNRSDNLLWAGRVSYNFWNVEQNPGYYTSSTYYGNGGDVLTLAFALQHHTDGAGGSIVTQGEIDHYESDFLGYSTDILMEKVLPNKGVLTLEGEYKVFETRIDEELLRAPTDTETIDCFCLFDGHSWTMTGLYLFPEKIGIGQFQPYVRFTENIPDTSTYRNEFEIGTNYIIDGHNARISLFYQYGDIATKGRSWSGPQDGDEVSAVKLALQWQI